MKILQIKSIPKSNKVCIWAEVGFWWRKKKVQFKGHCTQWLKDGKLVRDASTALYLASVEEEWNLQREMKELERGQ